MAIKKDNRIKEFVIPSGDNQEGVAANPASFPLPDASVVYNPAVNTLCYAIGDTGPGGGIIFGIPGTPSMVPADEYWEMTKTDLSGVDEPVWHYGMGGGSSSAYHPNTSTGCSQHPGGAEWGLFGVTGYNSVTNASMYWGDGETNTDAQYAIDTSTYNSNLSINPGGDSGCPNTFGPPCSPTQDTRLPAFRIAKDYNGGGKYDWFLPSWGEWIVALWNVGPMQGQTNPQYNALGLDLVGSNGTSPVHYWTSSASPGSSATSVWFPDGPQTAGVMIQSDQSGMSFFQGLRCFTRRVRAVRKFTCTVQPPCTGAACIDYNYRDGSGKTPGSFVQAGLDYNGNPHTNAVYSGSGNLGPAPWGAGAAGVAQNPVCWDSVMGCDTIQWRINMTDVKGHTFTLADWQDDSEGYTITIWDSDFTYLGKWHYATYNGYANWGGITFHGTPKMIYMKNPTHLDGPYPMVDYSCKQCNQCGSASAAYFKIEMAATNNNPNYQFENGVNETWLGNPSSTTYSNFSMWETPMACLYHPYYNYNVCYLWFATYQPSSCCTVYPTLAACNATNPPGNDQCGGGGSSLTGGSTSKLGIFDITKETGEMKLDDMTDINLNKPKTDSDYTEQIRKKRASDKRRAKNKKFKKK